MSAVVVSAASSPIPSSGGPGPRARRLRTAAAGAAAALALLGTLGALPPAAAPDRPPPGGSAGGPAVQQRPLGDLLRDLRGLYARSRAASSAYHGTSARLRTQRMLTRRAEAALGKARADLAAAHREAARLARVQYRQGDTGLPYALRLVLSEDPEGTLMTGHVLQRAAARQWAVLRELTSARLAKDAAARRARAALRTQEQLSGRRQRQRDTARRRLHAVEKALTSLPEDRLVRLDALLPPPAPSAATVTVRRPR